MRLAVTVTAPAASKCRVIPSEWLSRTKIGTRKRAAMPMGTLTKKIHSQPANSVSTPPARTPIAAPEPAVAPGSPCSARKAINMPEEVARPHASEKRAKAPRPTMKSQRLPRRSPTRPPREQKAAERERVAADDPLEVLGGEIEVCLNRRKCDVHDRDVENDHQVGDSEDGEGLPALGIFMRRHAAPLSSG